MAAKEHKPTSQNNPAGKKSQQSGRSNQQTKDPAQENNQARPIQRNGMRIWVSMGERD